MVRTRSSDRVWARLTAILEGRFIVSVRLGLG
jgi:hypothetical protein